MKRALAVVTGIVSGVLLAGMLSPMLMSLLPARLRSAGVLWILMSAAVAATVALFWWVSARSRR